MHRGKFLFVGSLSMTSILAGSGYNEGTIAPDGDTPILFLP